MDAAFLKRSNPLDYEARTRLHQGVRVDNPAVISVNMDVAAAAVNEFLARVHPYRVKQNKYFAIRRLCLSDPEAGSNELEGVPCPAMRGIVGTGDQELFLGMPLLANAT